MKRASRRLRIGPKPEQAIPLRKAAGEMLTRFLSVWIARILPSCRVPKWIFRPNLCNRPVVSTKAFGDDSGVPCAGDDIEKDVQLCSV